MTIVATTPQKFFNSMMYIKFPSMYGSNLVNNLKIGFNSPKIQNRIKQDKNSKQGKL